MPQNDLIERLRAFTYPSDPLFEEPIHPAICTEAADALAQLDAEIARLRNALIESGRAAGAILADDVSTDFLMLIPVEVKAKLAAHRMAAERAVVEWQPIETAPRDGTKFLAWCDAWEGEIHGVEHRQFAAITGDKPGPSDSNKEPVWWPVDGDAYAVWYRATHWMPLPAPPTPL